MSHSFDFVSIGDTATDAFIRIKDEGVSVHCAPDRERCDLCMRFGDKIPYEEVAVVPAVGNSANAAVSAARLGLSTAFVSNLGEDDHGKECLAALTAERVGTEWITARSGRKTNYHYVLWYKDDRTILIKHEEYDYALPDIGSPKWIYLSSLGENSLAFHAVLERYLWSHPEIKVAFQPGTFQMKMGRVALAGVYRRADLFFCNKEEAQRILEVEEQDIKKLLVAMRELGPRIVVITDGTKGAYAYDEKESFFMRAYPDPKPPYERTGAGDAFSSTFTVALALGMSVREALRWAPINSMSVVQRVGARAGLLNRAELEKLLAAAPEDYVPQPI